MAVNGMSFLEGMPHDPGRLPHPLRIALRYGLAIRLGPRAGPRHPHRPALEVRREPGAEGCRRVAYPQATKTAEAMTSDPQDLLVENSLLRASLWLTARALKNYHDAPHVRADDSELR